MRPRTMLTSGVHDSALSFITSRTASKKSFELGLVAVAVASEGSGVGRLLDDDAEGGGGCAVDGVATLAGREASADDTLTLALTRHTRVFITSDLWHTGTHTGRVRERERERER